MTRPKGQLMKLEPYTMLQNGASGLKMTINNLCRAEVGDNYYQEIMTNGMILLIPEKLYNETK
jgi:hypothetical protein